MVGTLWCRTRLVLLMGDEIYKVVALSASFIFLRYQTSTEDSRSEVFPLLYQAHCDLPIKQGTQDITQIETSSWNTIVPSIQNDRQ